MLDPDEPRYTIAAALKTLPPFERSLVRDHFINGDNVPTLMRRYGLKRRDVLACIEAALTAMRAALCARGVRGVGDVL
ncbi:MAG TPA: hypothetical protein VN442_08620 [Bryobacteraceae bacterium]|nr:hypothetical protein [Bryobacteraceae bacterium]